MVVVFFVWMKCHEGYAMQRDINKPFRGWKGTLFEGGIHVPMFIKWPGVISPNIVIDEPVSHVDLFPTILAAADFYSKEDEISKVDLRNPLSGINLLPSILKRGRSSSPSDESVDFIENSLTTRHLFWRSGHYKALRKGQWKLQKSANPDKMWLYNLKNDPYEWENLADKEPFKTDVLPSLLELLLFEDSQQAQPLWPSVTETAIFVDKLFETNETLVDEYVYWPN